MFKEEGHCAKHQLPVAAVWVEICEVTLLHALPEARERITPDQLKCASLSQWSKMDLGSGNGWWDFQIIIFCVVLPIYFLMLLNF